MSPSTTWTLKPFQKQTLEYLERSRNPKNHILCVAPTGAGKGVILEVYLSRHPHTRVVILCPLIALGRQLKERFVRTTGHTETDIFCGLGQTDSKLSDAKVFILSPEMFFTPHFQAFFKLNPIDTLFVDEAHCIEEWGESFRPVYQEIIPYIMEVKDRITSCLMTATPPPNLERRLRNKLEDRFLKVGNFQLPESLRLAILSLSFKDKLKRIEKISRTPECTLLFTNTRKHTEDLHFLLNNLNIKTIHYHAGYSSDERRILEKAVSALPHPWVVATSAFGMGMNYDHFERSIIFSPLHSVTSMVQAIGRVGRNQKKGCAEILWHPEDLRLLLRSGQYSEASQTRLREIFQFLNTPPKDSQSWLEKYFN